MPPPFIAPIPPLALVLLLPAFNIGGGAMLNVPLLAGFIGGGAMLNAEYGLAVAWRGGWC